MKTILTTICLILLTSVCYASPKIVIKSFNGYEWVRDDILTVWYVEDGCDDFRGGCSTKRESYADYLYEELSRDKRYIVEITWDYKQDLGSTTREYKFQSLEKVKLFIWLYTGYGFKGDLFKPVLRR